MKKLVLLCFLGAFISSQNSYSQELIFKNGIVQEVDTLVYNNKWANSENLLKRFPITKNNSKANSAENKITLERSRASTNRSESAGVSDQDLVNKFLIPYAPNVTSNLGNNVNISNDLYTKTKNINIPIYTFGGKEIQVPISLNRRTPFIRKGMKESEVGFNWRLSSGGGIYRIVKGKADESENGYFESYNKIENAKDLSRSEFDKGMKNEWDTSPDEFSFNFNGISGVFMFDRYKNIHIDSPHDLKILPTYTPNGRKIVSFLIIDNNGFVYHFGGQDNAIEETASKTNSYIHRYIPEGLYYELTPNENKLTVYNFIPDGSCFGCHVVDGGTVNVNLNDIVAPDENTGIGLSEPINFLNLSQIQNAFDVEPVNTGWKLTKIESPNKTDTIDFEYNTGGWVEYNNSENTTYRYRKSDAAFIMKVRNPDWHPPYLLSPELEFLLVYYTGQFYGARPIKWTAPIVSANPVFDNLDRTPFVINRYLTTVYNKTSSLIKIKNQYDEEINFNYTTCTINGFVPMFSENYGTPYSPKYLNNISISPTPSAYDDNILSIFETSLNGEVNLLSKLKVFDQYYSFEGDEVKLTKITYPTGGSIDFLYSPINSNFFEIEEVLNSGNGSNVVNKYLFRNSQNYYLSSHQIKLGISFENYDNITNKSYIDVYNSSSDEIYSKGVNRISGEVYKYTNGKLQSYHEFTTPEEKKDDKNYAYSRLTDTNPLGGWKHKTRPSTKDFERGIEKLTVQYNPQSDLNKIVSENKVEHEIVSSIKAVKLVNYYIGVGDLTSEETRSYSHYNYYFPIKKSSSSSNLNFFNNGKSIVSSTDVTFDTNYQNNNKVNQTIVTDSENNQIISRFKYPYSTVAPNMSFSPTLNADGEAYWLLNNRNMDNILTEQTTYKKFSGSNEELLLSSTVQLFKKSLENGQLRIHPRRVEIIEEDGLLNDYTPLNISGSGTNFYLNKDTRLKTKVEYERFDAAGNILQFRNKDDVPTSYIWGYQNRHVIAKVVGVEYQQIINAMGQSFLTTLNNSTDDLTILTYVQNVRDNFTQGFVTTYTYTSVIPKINSMTNENGVTTYYKYKNGRLASINDLNGHIIEEYLYNLKYKNYMYEGNLDCDFVDDACKSYIITIDGLIYDGEEYSYSYTD